MVKTDRTMSEPIYALCSFNRVKKWGRKTKKKQERHENMRPVSWKCGGGGGGGGGYALCIRAEKRQL